MRLSEGAAVPQPLRIPSPSLSLSLALRHTLMLPSCPSSIVFAAARKKLSRIVKNSRRALE
jgi:hypothetical protein